MLKRFFDNYSQTTIAQMPDKLMTNQRVGITSPIVGVIGAKGGVGSTSIVASLGSVLAGKGMQTSIIDANLQQPDVVSMFGKEPEHSLLELVKKGNQIDKLLFDACNIKLDNLDLPLSLLSPPIDGSAAFKINLSQLAQCLSAVQPYSQFWLIDLPRHLDKHLVTLMDKCNRIILVFEASVPGVTTCRRWLKIFSELGYAQNKIICVLNRAGSKYNAVENQLSTFFNEQPILRLPNASSLAWQCSTSGVPIAFSQPNHKYSQAIGKLAQHIHQSLEEN